MGTNLPPLEPLNVTLSREGRGILTAKVVMPPSPEESFRQFDTEAFLISRSVRSAAPSTC
jgi:hypothetical protein